MSGAEGGAGLPEREPGRHLRRTAVAAAWTRAFDLAVASLGLLLAAPLFLLIGLLVKLDSRGPVFYRQDRVGRHRRPFRMWKFRKMYEDLPTQGPMLTARYDARMTRVGRLLERTKLDELPQLLNVLRGDMSVVGPRPEVSTFVERLPSELWNEVLSIKPGIFGPNQLRNRNESELYPPGCEDPEAFYLRHILPDKLEVDARYAREAGPVEDVGLLLRGVAAATFGAVTWRTLATRRIQIANLLLLAALGVAGTIVAHVVAGEDLGSRLAIETILLAALAKTASLVAFRVPNALPSSLTDEDFVRGFWCALSSAALIALGLYWLEGREISRLVLVLDTALFVGALFLAKLLVYRLYVTFRVQRTRALARRLILASGIVAPLCALVAVAAYHGLGVWSNARELAVSMVLLATTVRPATLLLLRLPMHRRRPAAWLASEWPHLVVSTLVGSALIALGALLLGQPVPYRGDILIDAALFGASMTAFALWENARIAAASPVPERTAGRRRRLLVVGSGLELSAYVGALATLPERDYEVAGILTPYGGQRTSTVGGHPVRGGIEDLPEMLKVLAIDCVVVLRHDVSRESRDFIETCCRQRDVPRVSLSLLAGILSTSEAPREPEAEALQTADATAVRAVPVPEATSTAGRRAG